MAIQQVHDGNDEGVQLGQGGTVVNIGGTGTPLGGSTSVNTIKVGRAAADTVGFFGTTAVSQRSSTAQVTSILQSASAGTGTVAVIAEICATLTALGLWKGS